MRDLHDHYFKLAKERGFLSRSAFKLIELDDRKRLVKAGDWVLDAGCAPGSWLQVIAGRVGPRGCVAGVDLKEVDPRRFESNVRVVQGDIESVTLDELLGPWRRERPGPAPFNAILSDIGPDTTGDPSGDSARSVRLCQMLLDRAGEWLRPGGNLAMKVYEGGDYPELLRRAKREFDDARGFKPDASRGESVEMYIVCHKFRPPRPAKETGASPLTPRAAPPARRRSSGWGRREGA